MFQFVPVVVAVVVDVVVVAAEGFLLRLQVNFRCSSKCRFALLKL